MDRGVNKSSSRPEVSPAKSAKTQQEPRTLSLTERVIAFVDSKLKKEDEEDWRRRKAG